MMPLDRGSHPDGGGFISLMPRKVTTSPHTCGSDSCVACRIGCDTWPSTYVPPLQSAIMHARRIGAWAIPVLRSSQRCILRCMAYGHPTLCGGLTLHNIRPGNHQLYPCA